MKKLFFESWKWYCHSSKETIFPILIRPLLSFVPLAKYQYHVTFIVYFFFFKIAQHRIIQHKILVTRINFFVQIIIKSYFLKAGNDIVTLQRRQCFQYWLVLCSLLPFWPNITTTNVTFIIYFQKAHHKTNEEKRHCVGKSFLILGFGVVLFFMQWSTQKYHINDAN